MYHRQTFLVAALAALTVSAQAQTAFDTISPNINTLRWGDGSYGVTSAYGTAMSFTSGASGYLKDIVVPISDSDFSGVQGFTLTLYSGTSSDFSTWTQLGLWSSQTAGDYDGLNKTLIDVNASASNVQLSTGVTYFLAARATNPALDGNGDSYLNWAYYYGNGYYWHTPQGPFFNGVLGAFKVTVGSSPATEPAPAFALAAGLGVFGIARRRRG